MKKNYSKAFTLLLEKQTAFHFKKRKTKEVLYQNIPELYDIDREMNRFGVDLAYKSIAQDNKAIKRIQDEMMRLDLRKKELIFGHASVITSDYYCELCQDKGLINQKICQCLSQCIMDLSFSGYDLKAKAKRETFDVFNPDYYSDKPLALKEPSPREHALKIKQMMLTFCDRYDSIKDNLLFTGRPGVGKTFTSNCIVNKLGKNGYSIIYITAAHLVSQIQDQLFRDGKSSAQAFEPLLLCDLLIIDDLGAEHSTEYSQKQLYEVIDSRLNAEKKMIISTNLSVMKIVEVYDERLSSRIGGYFKNIRFLGDDIRLIKAQNS